MALLEAELTTALLADAGISGIVATRVYPGILPQNPTYPALTYTLVSGPRKGTFTGAGIKYPRYQFDAFARSYGGALALAAALKAFMPATKTTWGSTAIDCAQLEDERDLPWDDDADVFRRMVDYRIWTND